MKEKTIYKKWWFWLIILVLLFVILPVPKTKKDENKADSLQENKQLSLLNSNAKETYEILCEIAELETNEKTSDGDSFIYTSSNNNYYIELGANEQNEINKIRIYTLNFPENYENFYYSACRIKYKGSNQSEAFNWILENLGKNSNTTIGDANFKLSTDNLNNPILEIIPSNQ